MISQPVPKARSLPIESWIHGLALWVKERRATVTALRALDQCGEEASRMARDFGMTKDALYDTVARGPHAADELPGMLSALGLDRATIGQSLPAVMRDLERHCVMCGNKAKCRHELALGRAAEHYRTYCVNAETIEALQAKA